MLKRRLRSLWSLLMIFVLMVPLGFSLLSSPAEAVTEKPKEGKLFIHKLKFTGVQDLPSIMGDGAQLSELPSGAAPSPDVEFAVVSLKKSKLSASPSQAEAIAYYNSVKNNPSITQTTGKTDAAGIFETKTLPADKYLVVELTSELGATKIAAPVVVSLPTMNSDGSAWNDQVHIYTKNAVTLGAAKTQKLTEDNQPLIGATFSLYKKGLTGQPDNLVQANLVSHGDGYTDIIGNLVVGDYYFVETNAPDNFLLNGRKIDFSIKPENHAYDESGTLDETKVVSTNLLNYLKPTLSGERLTDESTDIGQTVTWKVTTDVPKNITDYTKYVITNTLESHLSYIGNITITLDGVVVNPSHYKVTESNGVITIIFIDELFPGATDQLANGKQLIITFDTVINHTAVPGTPISNNSILTVNNGYVDATSTHPTAPSVETGGRKFLKVNSSQKPLANAEFVIYKNVNGKGHDGYKGPLYLQRNNDKTITWTKEKKDATVLTSDQDGKFEAYGLGYGSYLLEETKAPSGYNLLTEDKKFTIDKKSYSDEAQLVIVNTNAPTIPITGSIGTILFFVLGLILMGLAFLIYRKKYSHA
ncbi:SpaH/EbpB family LPXTG-anchored major pilin [Enterococcus quebecensis]|uniref:SpaH/EbpB family LPXTG-anchored major pilin n=1 Tax=Enterococcus quebecensis TaxID=903983 RepID=UPI000AEE2B60|nr:SpaH/EbpB family LPXTG-anchored major pilin [Enterococcus quebecensis]